MHDSNDFQTYLPISSEPKRCFTEEPPPLPPEIKQVPTGLAPMSRVELEGRAFRGLASGSQPWWVIIMGWVVFGVPCLSVLVVTISLASLGEGVAVLPLLGAIAICAVYFWIVLRGTKAKLNFQKRCRAKYRRGMVEK